MIEPVERDLAGQLQLAELEVGSAGIGIDLERVVRRAEEAGDLAGELHDVVHHVRQGDERGQALHLRQARAEDRAKARRIVAVVAQQLEVALERVATAKRRERRGVVVGHRVVHAPDDRQPIHDPGRVRHVLADPEPRNARRDRAEHAPDLPGRSGFMSHVSRWLGRRSRRSGCTIEYVGVPPRRIGLKPSHAIGSQQSPARSARGHPDCQCGAVHAGSRAEFRGK